MNSTTGTGVRGQSFSAAQAQRRSIFAAVGVVIAVLGGFASWVFLDQRARMDAHIEEEVGLLGRTLAWGVGNWFESKSAEVEAASWRLNREFTDSRLETEFSQMVEHGEFIHVFYGYENARFEVRPDAFVPDDFDPRVRGWSMLPPLRLCAGTAGDYVFSNFYSNFWLILANFERLFLGCIEAKFASKY